MFLSLKKNGILYWYLLSLYEFLYRMIKPRKYSIKILNLIKLLKQKLIWALRQNLTWARKLDYHDTFNSSAFCQKKKSSTTYLVYSGNYNECESA